MNAARPSLSLAFSSASLPATPEGVVAARPRHPKKPRPAAQPAPAELPADEYSACLTQARICREQAQEAARLKRFRAAVGLFQTAISLCQRAVSLRKSPAFPATEPSAEAPPGDGEAREYLQVLAIELSTYDELMRSMNRPLVDPAH